MGRLSELRFQFQSQSHAARAEKMRGCSGEKNRWGMQSRSWPRELARDCVTKLTMRCMAGGGGEESGGDGCSG